ncbi:MAG TPA: hypothetical protein VMG12_28430 [Polyangiaceae bacterium]|nr:hypothetical protein [Polyangiaceae bacterium]
MTLGFKNRDYLLRSVRNLVVDVCSEYLDSFDTTQQLVVAVQELLENLVKYSESGVAELDFELGVFDGQPSVRIGTLNRASAVHLTEAKRMLERTIAAPDPLELFQALVATSGERKGSGLGLVRLRAEAGLALSYAVENGRLRIEARRRVQPRQVGD